MGQYCGITAGQEWKWMFFTAMITCHIFPSSKDVLSAYGKWIQKHLGTVSRDSPWAHLEVFSTTTRLIDSLKSVRKRLTASHVLDLITERHLQSLYIYINTNINHLGWWSSVFSTPNYVFQSVLVHLMQQVKLNLCGSLLRSSEIFCGTLLSSCSVNSKAWLCVETDEV